VFSSHHDKQYSFKMSRLAKKFRLEKRTRGTHPAGAPGSDSLSNSPSDPPSSSKMPANAITFSTATPSSASGNLGAQSGTDNSVPPGGLGNADRFLVTHVEDPRVQVLDQPACTHSAANPSCLPLCTHEIEKVAEALVAADMQKWLEETPSKAELEVSRDEILAALEFDTGKGKNDPKKGKNATPSVKMGGADNNVSSSKAAEVGTIPKDSKSITLSPQKRRHSSASTGSVSSIGSDLFYGRGPIQPVDTLEPFENPPASTPSPPVTGEAAQNTSNDESQAEIASGKGQGSVLSRSPSQLKASMASKMTFKFKGKPFFSPKPVHPTDANPTATAGDLDNRPKAHPKSLRSRSSIASIDQMTAEPEAALKKNDGRLGSKFSGAHNFFKTGRSPSSHFTAPPALSNSTTDPELSLEPLTIEPNIQLFSTPMGSHLSAQKPSTEGKEATRSREELSMPPSATSNASVRHSSLAPFNQTNKTDRVSIFQRQDPTSESNKARSNGESLADLLGGQVTPSSSGNNQATVIQRSIALAGAMNNSTESTAHLNQPTSDKGKAVEGNIPPAQTPAPKTPRKSTKNSSSPLFNIHKKSSLRALRIQLDFFNKLLAEIQRKIDKIIIYQPTAALLERLRQLKHTHRGIILTLGAAPILEDMKAVGYQGKLLEDLEAFQARLDEYDWEHEDDDPMANPFGLPVEPAWRGPQFEDD